MGKTDSFTPKGIANRMKSKGLQKLRWYCQMCEKQCRDENGFKCHLTSESHVRMMSTFGANPDKFIDEFSNEFKKSFLEHLGRTHRNTRVEANKVYNEFIADKQHLHMNATRWPTLTDFVKWLGKEGICEVEDTPKGWFICYTPTDAAELLRKQLLGKRKAAEEAEEVRQERQLREQIARAQAARPRGEGDEEAEAAPTALVRGEGERLEVELAASRRAPAAAAETKLTGAFSRDGRAAPSAAAAVAAAKSGPGTLDKLMRETEAAKEREARKKDWWVAEGIVVKVVAKELRGYYKQKGVVQAVVDRYVGEVRVLEGGDVLRVDQSQLETVIPAVGAPVLVLKGLCRGCRGVLLGLVEDKFQARVRVTQRGEYEGRELSLEYEDFSKLHAA